MSAARERLQALRHELARADVEGFVLPRTDMFGSEYLPAAEERVAWLTGFTGSAARVVVLREQAAVFTDGRYALQVRVEVDQDLYATPHLVEEPPAKWLKRQARAGDRVGYDPTLHTKADIEALTAALKSAGAALVPLEANPVDTIWADRPAPPCAPIRGHPLAHAGEASRAKRERLLQEVRDAGADALLVSAADGIAWLLNIRGADIPFNPVCLGLALVLPGGRAVLLTDPRKVAPAFAFEDAEIGLHDLAARRALYAQLAAEGVRVLVDPAVTHAGLVRELTDAGLCVIEGNDPVTVAKARKNDAEIEGARRAQRIDGVAVTRFLAWLDGVARTDEISAAERLHAERARDASYLGPSFDTISGAGPNGAIVHYRVSADSNRELEAGSLYLVDSGGQYVDATTDITRTVAIGAPTAEMRRRFTLVLKGHIAVTTALFPKGTRGSQLDPFARRALWAVGLDFDHGTGHGVGSHLCVHEGPQRLAKRGGDAALEPGMIVSNEPGSYVADAFGIRIENLLLVVERGTPAGGEKALLGFETLTLAPIDLRLVDASLLDDAERAWLDAYHDTVRDSLAPLLDAPTRAWLEQTTQPLAAAR